MRWNLRMNAAERGIWKSTEMRRRLADAGLEISAGKMSALWTGDPDHDPPRRPRRDLRRAGVHTRDLLIPNPKRSPPATPKPRRRSQVGWSQGHTTGWDAAVRFLPPDARTARLCKTCGQKPEANKDRSTATTACRGGPLNPPTCERVGRIIDYYADGLCAGAITIGPRPVDSCRGLPRLGRHPYSTPGCAGPAGPGDIKYPLGICASCQAVLAIDAHDVCRLCWRNAGAAGPRTTP